MRWIGFAMAGALLGCGSKADDAKNAIEAVGAVASGEVQDRVDEAEKFRQDRIARAATPWPCPIPTSKPTSRRQ